MLTTANTKHIAWSALARQLNFKCRFDLLAPDRASGGYALSAKRENSEKEQEQQVKSGDEVTDLPSAKSSKEAAIIQRLPEVLSLHSPIHARTASFVSDLERFILVFRMRSAMTRFNSLPISAVSWLRQLQKD